MPPYFSPKQNFKHLQDLQFPKYFSEEVLLCLWNIELLSILCA